MLIDIIQRFSRRKFGIFLPLIFFYVFLFFSLFINSDSLAFRNFYDSCIFGDQYTPPPPQMKLEVSPVDPMCKVPCEKQCNNLFSVKYIASEGALPIEINQGLIYECIRRCQAGQPMSARRREIKQSRVQGTNSMNIFYYPQEPQVMPPHSVAACQPCDNNYSPCFTDDGKNGCKASDDAQCLPVSKPIGVAIYTLPGAVKTKGDSVKITLDKDQDNTIALCGKRLIQMTPVYPNLIYWAPDTLSQGDSNVIASDTTFQNADFNVRRNYFDRSAGGFQSNLIDYISKTKPPYLSAPDQNVCFFDDTALCEQLFYQSVNGSFFFDNSSNVTDAPSAVLQFQKYLAYLPKEYTSDIMTAASKFVKDLHDSCMQNKRIINVLYNIPDWWSGNRQKYFQDMLDNCTNPLSPEVKDLIKNSKSMQAFASPPQEWVDPTQGKLQDPQSTHPCFAGINEKIWRTMTNTSIVNCYASGTCPLPDDPVPMMHPDCFWGWNMRNQYSTDFLFNIQDGDFLRVDWGGLIIKTVQMDDPLDPTHKTQITQYMSRDSVLVAAEKDSKINPPPINTITSMNTDLSNLKLLTGIGISDIKFSENLKFNGGQCSSDSDPITCLTVCGDSSFDFQTDTYLSYGLQMSAKKTYDYTADMQTFCNSSSDASDASDYCKNNHDTGGAPANRYTPCGLLRKPGGKIYSLSPSYGGVISGFGSQPFKVNNLQSNDGRSVDAYNNYFGGLNANIYIEGQPIKDGEGLQYSFGLDGKHGQWKNVDFCSGGSSQSGGCSNTATIVFDPATDLPSQSSDMDGKNIDVYFRIDEAKLNDKGCYVGSEKKLVTDSIGDYNLIIDETPVVAGKDEDDEGFLYKIVQNIDELMFGKDHSTKAYSVDADSTDPSKIKQRGIVGSLFYNFTQEKGYIAVINALLILSLLIYAVSFMIGLTELNQREGLIFGIKFAFVVTMISPYSWQFFGGFLVPMFVDGSFELIKLFVSSAIQNVSDSDLTHDKYSIFAMFDDVLKLMFSQANFIKLLAILFSSFFGLLFLLAIVFCIVIYTVCVIKALVLFVFCIIANAFLICIAPIVIPTILFKNTKQIFDTWIKNLISYALQPPVVFASIMFFNVAIIVTITAVFSFSVCDNKCLINLYDYFVILMPFIADAESLIIPDNDWLCILYWYQPVLSMHSPPGYATNLTTPGQIISAAMVLMLLCYSMYQFIDIATSLVYKLIFSQISESHQSSVAMAATKYTASSIKGFWADIGNREPVMELKARIKNFTKRKILEKKRLPGDDNDGGGGGNGGGGGGGGNGGGGNGGGGGGGNGGGGNGGGGGGGNGGGGNGGGGGGGNGGGGGGGNGGGGGGGKQGIATEVDPKGGITKTSEGGLKIKKTSDVLDDREKSIVQKSRSSIPITTHINPDTGVITKSHNGFEIKKKFNKDDKVD